MTRGFARILVPTDFSPPSKAALAAAEALAAQFGASIHLIHVLEDPLLLGSVTERVVRAAECPVLTVRGTAAALATLNTDAAHTPVGL